MQKYPNIRGALEAVGRKNLEKGGLSANVKGAMGIEIASSYQFIHKDIESSCRINS